MSEPVKVNAYHKVATFTTRKKCWWVLSDGNVAFIVKPENAVLVKEEELLYSILYSSNNAKVFKFKPKDIEMIMITQYGITLRERKENGNKKDDTKI